MAHLRNRILEAEIRKDLKWSPVVSVLGMRQVGKSTLLRQIGANYLTLDDDQLQRKFELGEWAKCIIDSRNAMAGVQTKPGLVWKA